MGLLWAGVGWLVGAPWGALGVASAASGVEAQLVCVTQAGATDIEAFAVAVTVDTATRIAASQLDVDCADLRVTDLAGLPLPFWLEGGTCDAVDTRVWVRLERIGALGEPVSLVIHFDGTPVGAAGDGEGVFPFFDDFSGTSLVPGRWGLAGSGTNGIADGVLFSQGSRAMWTTTPQFPAFTHRLVVRIDAEAQNSDAVEMGGGVTDHELGEDDVGALQRDWIGFTHGANDDPFVAIAPGPAVGATCDFDTYTGSFFPSSGQPRVWTRFEIGYEEAGNTLHTWIETGGSRIDRFGDLGCLPPLDLPVLLVLDPVTGAGQDPLQRLDFVLVRPVAFPDPVAEPIDEVDTDLDGLFPSEEGCGDADGDGTPDYLDGGSTGTTLPTDTGPGTVDPFTGPDRRPVFPTSPSAVGCSCDGAARPDLLGAAASAALGLLLRRPARGRVSG